MLSDRDIRAFMFSGGIKIEPFDTNDTTLIQPASIDVRLADMFVELSARREFIDPALPHPHRKIFVDDDSEFLLYPGDFLLASTVETLTLSNEIAARIEGKSSLGRLGLLTHVTAGFIDPGFSGQITLELCNVASLPIILRPGMKIGQLCFFLLSGPAERPYGHPGLGSHYQHQAGATASRTGTETE